MILNIGYSLAPVRKNFSYVVHAFYGKKEGSNHE